MGTMVRIFENVLALVRVMGSEVSRAGGKNANGHDTVRLSLRRLMLFSTPIQVNVYAPGVLHRNTYPSTIYI
jgi:hypothetical protein